MAMNDAVDWRADLGGGTRVALVQAGTFRSDAGTLLGPVPWVLWGDLVKDEIDDKRRLLQALNCLLIETPAGRVLVETGIGERFDEKTRAIRSVEGPWIVPALERAGFDPDSVDAVAMSHLHFDHAGGLLRADGVRAFPRARIVAQKAEWEVALGDNPRLVASYVQPELRLVHDWGAEGWVDGERELLPGVTVVPTGGHSTGHQAVIVRGTGGGGRGPRAGSLAGSGTVAFLGDLFMRPWGANPRWVTAFDDFPLDSVVRKAELFRQAVDEDWLIVLSHEVRHPIGRLRPDRDRFRFEPI
jgi:glyoxylase-like metal-dependent hydrolase (beta-lactamase superfamily II)